MEYILKGRIYTEASVALSIRNPEAEKLARTVARETGESLTQAITRSLEERLQRSNRCLGRLGEIRPADHDDHIA